MFPLQEYASGEVSIHTYWECTIEGIREWDRDEKGKPQSLSSKNISSEE